jgi:hypothetical protein
MKQFSALMTSFLLLSAISFAQTSAGFKMDAGKFSEEYNAEKSGINTKVISNFDHMFAGASNIQWSKDKHNIDRVYFEKKGKVIRAAFNQKGQFLYSISTYGEELLPQDVLLMVKETYFGKSIFGVTEVSAMGKSAYLIILEDKTSWLHIKVLDGEMTEEKTLLKAN